MNKKKGLLGVMFTFFLIKLIPLVSAYGFGYGFIDLRQGGYQVIQWVQDFATPFFEILLDTRSGEFFFAKCLMLLLLFMIIFFTLEKSEMFGNKRGLIFIIAAVVSILAMRYLPESDLITGMLLPYGTLGVALLTFLPFLIYFFFVHKSVPGGFGRRAAWGVYALVFLFLWALRYTDMSPTSNWLYVAGLILVILSFMFDKSIHRYFSYGDFEKIEERMALSSKNNALIRLHQLQSIPEHERSNSVRDEIKWIRKKLRND